jgi:hypothetical protein
MSSAPKTPPLPPWRAAGALSQAPDLRWAAVASDGKVLARCCTRAGAAAVVRRLHAEGVADARVQELAT